MACRRSGPWLLALLLGCGGAPRHFSTGPALWRDDDMAPFAPKPEPYPSPLGWNGAQQTIFGPMASALWVKLGREAINVNAMDEVPDSSWYLNRLSKAPISPAEVAQGSCPPPIPDEDFPWTVAGAKLEGQTAGFRIRTHSGKVNFLEFDFPQQPELATAAGAIGSRLYHALGFNAVCDRVVFFRAEDLLVPPPGTTKKPVTQQEVDLILAHASKSADGRYRAKASLLAEGESLGNWTYDGTKDDDPNDVVAHEDRRELRGTRLVTAWLNHSDTGENNTLAMWIPAGGGKGYVRHYTIDWNDSLGFLWPPGLDAFSRQLGYAYYFDFDLVGRNFLTLGLIESPWDRAHYGKLGPVLGYFDDRDFDPEKWKAGYPNPAFSRMTERDAAWMARLLARLGPEHIRAMVSEGRIENRELAEELVRILQGRREKILRRYLLRLSSLTDPTVERHGDASWLCLHDRVEEAGLGPPPAPSAVHWFDATTGARLAVSHLEGGAVCAVLPEPRPGFTVVDVDTGRPGQGPARVHLHDGTQIIGLQRPETGGSPQ